MTKYPQTHTRFADIDTYLLCGISYYGIGTGLPNPLFFYRKTAFTASRYAIPLTVSGSK